jgi:hypothetical protein
MAGCGCGCEGEEADPCGPEVESGDGNSGEEKRGSSFKNSNTKNSSYNVPRKVRLVCFASTICRHVLLSFGGVRTQPHPIRERGEAQWWPGRELAPQGGSVAVAADAICLVPASRDTVGEPKTALVSSTPYSSPTLKWWPAGTKLPLLDPHLCLEHLRLRTDATSRMFFRVMLTTAPC